MASSIRVIDDALVDRVLSLNPRCRRLNLSHNEITHVEGGGSGDGGGGGGGGVGVGQEEGGAAAVAAASAAAGGRPVPLPASLGRGAASASPFARLPNLVYLNLSYNMLVELGPAFAALTSLGTLDVSHNRL
jgi:Leucine-rich repeat (LRR) protein